MWENFRVGGPKVCNEVIISAAAVFGRYFDTDDLAFLTSDDELRLEELAGEEKVALFLVIPQSTATYNFMVSMIYSQLFDIVMKMGKKWRERYRLSDPRLPRHLSFWLDEFANCGRIPNFLQLLSVVRKYNISINIIIQGMAQLKGMYPREEWESILANLDTMIYLGGMEPGTVKWLSEKLGKETIRQVSASSGRAGGSQNFSNTGRALMTPDEIEQMSRSNELIFISGCKPIRTKKYDLRKHPNYGQCGEANENNNFDAALYFKTEKIDYVALEEARVKKEDIEGYDFRRIRVKDGVKRGTLPVKGAEKWSPDQSTLTEDEKKRRIAEREKAAQNLNQNPENLLYRVDLSNAKLYSGYRADYEFAGESEEKDMMKKLNINLCEATPQR